MTSQEPPTPSDPTASSNPLPPPPPPQSSAASPALHMPLKQKMTTSFKSLLTSARKLALGDNSDGTGPATLETLFAKTDPAVDGEECLLDCESCTVKYPRTFKTEEHDLLYGHVKGWSTHLLVATGKTDWVRDVEDEKGSVMEAVGRVGGPSNGRLKLSASNIPTPSGMADYSEPTTVLLLPAFVMIDNVTPESVPLLIEDIVSKAPTNTTPLEPISLPKALPPPTDETKEPKVSNGTEPIPNPLPLISRPCPHQALILLCSQKTRDARCGQSAPLIKKELERHLRPLGLYRDLDDERPGGVGIYFISHVGGHKYSANMMVYRRPDAFGMDTVERVKDKEAVPKPKAGATGTNGHKGAEGQEESGDPIVAGDVGAGQCIWLARVRPEDCENIVRYTVLQGKVVKPERQLRGGFDRGKGLLSW